MEEREVASSQDLEEDCGERMEHNGNRTDIMAALEIMTWRDTTMVMIFSKDSLQELYIPYWVKQSRLCYC